MTESWARTSMQNAAFPIIKDIVLIGGGHAHVDVLRSFGMFPIKGARLTLISPEIDTPYSGMLPGLIAGHYTFDEAHIDLGPLARFAGARYIATHVTGIDAERRLIHCCLLYTSDAADEHRDVVVGGGGGGL